MQKLCAPSLVAIVLFVAMGSSCFRQPQKRKQPTVEQAKVAALKECGKGSQKTRELCTDVVNKSAKHYESFVKGQAYYENLAKKKDASLLKEITIAKSACLDGSESECRRYKRLVQQRQHIVDWRLSIPALRTIASQNTTRAIADTPRTLAANPLKTNVKAVCKLRSSGFVDCVPMSSLLALHDPSMDAAIIQDVNRLYEVAELDPRNTAVISCGAGIFAGTELASTPSTTGVLTTSVLTTSRAEFGQLPKLSDAIAKELSWICQQLALEGSGRGSLTGGEGGFSEATGLDGIGSGIFCDRSKGGSSADFQDFVDQAMAFAKASMERCTSDMVAEGEEPPIEPIPNPKPPPEPGPTKPEDPPPNPCAGKSTETCTPTDVPPETTVDPKTGKTTTASGTTGSDGSVSERIVLKDAKGNVILIHDQVQDPSGKVLIDKFVDYSSGFTTTTLQTTQPGGITQTDIWTRRQSDGKLVTETHTLHTGLGDWYIADSKGKYHLRDCGSDGCESCNAFGNAVESMLRGGGCATGTGKPSLSCRGYSSAMGCCGSSAFPVDPRVLMPNPDGNLMCMGQQDVDATDEVCKKKCSVASAAYEEDCLATCGVQIKVPEYSVLDAVCQQALIEDACYSSRDGVVGGAQPPPPWEGGVGPAPPTHNVLPDFNSPGGGGMGPY